MELRHIRGNTWYLAGKEFIPLYCLDEHHCILLDSGLRAEREELTASLAEHGLTPAGILGSHVHRDHSVNHFWLRETYGCPVVLPEGEAALCASLTSIKSVYDTLPPSLFLTDLELNGIIGHVDGTIGPEDGPFTFCGATFRILHTPGHTPDHICTVTPDDVCYLGDAVLSPGVWAHARLPYHYDHATALTSAEKLRGLSCAAWVAAHREVSNTPLSGLIEQNSRAHQAAVDAILALIPRPMTLEETGRAVFEHFRLLTSDPVKAGRYIRNLRTLLDYAVDLGKLTLTARRGMVLYTPEKNSHLF
jgi:glyoxylase-like metal-dependent hydrolase (beta-lactamase superfamily II)